MKTKLHFLCLGLFFLASLAQTQTPCAAATLSVVPGVVSNTYNGTITLQIGGLAAGETVVVKKYLDANGNGVIDAGDWLVQQFSLTDGSGGMVIGGVTNFNVPGDTDTTAGQITAKLNFQNGDISQTIVAPYLFQVSSPAGSFSTITKPFSVTSFPYPQKFTGNVVSNNTGATLSDAVVLLFPPTSAKGGGGGSGPMGGAVANSSGVYSIMAPAGTYSLIAVRSNFVADMQETSDLVLAAGATVTQNVDLHSTTRTISGKIIDTNTGAGLAGMLVPVEAGGNDSKNLLAIGFTDTDGKFAVGVTSNTWGIDNDSAGLAVRGYVGLQNKTNVDATAGSVSGVTIALPKATALFYGSVKDNMGNPFVGMDVSAYDSTNMFSGDAFTDANGNYVLGVLGLGTNDEWNVQANGKEAITNYVFSQQNQSTSINAKQAVLENITGALATHYIVGTVTDSDNNPIPGVGVNANGSVNGLDYSANVDTDTNGNYSLLVANGTWNLDVSCYGGGDSLGGNYACPNNQSVTISGNNATNNFIVQFCGGISITTALPPGEVNQNYNQFLQASSCAGNFSWLLFSGSLPSNLNWNPNGEIYGTPTDASTNAFTFKVTDANGLTTNQTLSLTIYAQLQVMNTSLPNPTIGVSYGQALQAGGGLAPYTWSLSPGSSSLPPGLGLTNGVISGIPATNGGPFGFSVRVTDNLGYTSDQPLSLTIVCSGVMITTTSLPAGEINVPYFQSLQASSCSSTFTWSLFSGSLPPGLALAANGSVLGTPTNSVTNSFTVTVLDANDLATNQSLSLTILDAVMVTTGSLPGGANGASYSQPLQASGGLTPYSWSLSPGSARLPAGLGLTNGVISGIPTTNGGGPFVFSVRVTDNLGGTFNQTLSLTIAPPPLQIGTTTLPAALQNLPYTNALSASGGQPPYTWISTNLPIGLTLATNGVISGMLATIGTNAFTVRVTDVLGGTTNQMLSLTVNLAQGSLQVTLQPGGAVTNGAEWQVDGGPWKTSGAVLSGLSLGSHTLSFNVMSGWSTPSNQTVTITSGTTNLAAGLYTPQKAMNVSLTIASPKPRQSLNLTNDIFLVTGTAKDTLPAKDNVTVEAVYYKLNSGNWTLATAANNSWSNWTATITVLAGTNNTLSAYAVDTGSNASAIAKVAFNYIPSAMLTVSTNGFGAIQPNVKGKLLPIGANEILAALPSKNWIFSNWVASGSGNFVSNNPVLNITMQPGLTLTANFVTNVFLAAQGTPYNGLFAPTNAARQQTNSGAITFTVTSGGVLSGKLTIGTNTPSLSGKFSPAGAVTITTPRKGLSTLTTTLQLDFANQTASGSITDGNFDAQVIADLQQKTTNYEGQYTLIIPGTTNAAIGPFGTSYGTAAVKSGAIAFVGSLADGKSVNLNSVVSKDGYWPFYLSLYGGSGSFWSWNCFTNGAIVSMTNASWINAKGFTNEAASIIGSTYTSADKPLLTLTHGQVLLDGGDLPFTITNQFTLAPNNTITLTNATDTNKVTLTIKTGGLITGSFANPSNPKQTISINGVLLQNQTNAQGYFLGTNQSGTFMLMSP